MLYLASDAQIQPVGLLGSKFVALRDIKSRAMPDNQIVFCIYSFVNISHCQLFDSVRDVAIYILLM